MNALHHLTCATGTVLDESMGCAKDTIVAK